MRIETINPGRTRFERARIPAWVPLTLLAIGCPLAAWSVFASQGGGTLQFVPYEMATGWFVLLALGYLGLHGVRRMAWSAVPALFTIQALAYFVVIPIWRFASGDDQVDSGYVHAMWLVLIGFTAFWVGSLILLKNTEMRFIPRFQNTSERVALVSTAMCGIGMAAKVFMWRAGLFSYLSDVNSVGISGGAFEWLVSSGDLLSAALVVSAIEVFGKRSRQPLIRFVFGLSLVASVGFGIISGMKGQIVAPLLFLLLVYGITRGRLPRTVILLPMILVASIYPFVNAYRNNLSKGYASQVNTVEGLEAVLVQSFDDAFSSFDSSSADATQSSSDQAKARLSYLSFVRDIIDLPAPSLLSGDEKVWMAPIYPLVPRFLWKDKPVMDKGKRLAEALGSSSGTSSAMTPIGDLFSLYGAYGVLIGMFLYGLCLQGYMNWLGRHLSESGLFIHISMLMTFLAFEGDVVGTIQGVIHSFLVVLVTSYIIYGRQTSCQLTANAIVR